MKKTKKFFLILIALFSMVFLADSVPISANEEVSVQLSKIQVKTSLNLDGTWNREVSFFVPKASMDADEATVKNFLEEGVVKGSLDGWKDYKENGEKGRVYTIRAENIPVETMEKLMQKAFHTEKTSVKDESETYYTGESNANLIRSSAYISENYDLSEFVSGKSDSLQIEFITESNGKESSNTYEANNSKWSVDQEYTTYLLPTGIDMTCKVLGADKYKRTFEFTFQGLEKEEKEFLKSQAETLVKKSGKVRTKDKKDTYTLTISIKGDKETVGELYKKLFGCEMDTKYAAEHKWMGFSNTFAYGENIYLGAFIPSGTGRVVDVNYELSFGTGMKVKSKVSNAYEEKGNKLYLSGPTDSTISVSLYGSKLNPRGTISVLVLVLAIASGLFFVLLLLTKKRKCTGCGEKFENSKQKFCTKCGKKRGE